MLCFVSVVRVSSEFVLRFLVVCVCVLLLSLRVFIGIVSSILQKTRD